MKQHVREVAIQGIVLIVLLAAAFPGFFLRGEVLSPADILYQSKPWSNYAPSDWDGPSNRLMPDIVAAFYPYYSLTKMELAEGNWPLWNRYELAGMPLIANAQTAVFYPPRLLHEIFDVPFATSLYILLKLWLCGITAYLCARGLRMGVHASRFASVAWMLCSYNVIWAYWSLPDESAWLPLVFLGAVRVLEGKTRQGGILVALSGTLLLFAGHPETAFTMAFGVGVYFFLRLASYASNRKRVAQAIGAMVIAWGAAILVTSLQVVPLVEYIRHSLTYTVRDGGIAEPTILASTLSAIWVPRLYGTFPEFTYWGAGLLNSNIIIMFYTGLLVWIFAWFGGVPIRESKGRAHFWALMGSSVFCLLIAFDLNELHVLNSIPPFNSTLKVYFVSFPVFAMTLLGARGLDAWLASSRAARGLYPLIPAIGIPVVFLYFLMGFEGPVLAMSGFQEYVNRQLMLALLLGIASIAVVLLGCAVKKTSVVAATAIIILAVDLLIATRGMNPTMRKADVFPETELTKYLAAFPAPTRFGVGEGGVVSGTFAPYGIEEWLGYDGLYPARIKQFQQKLADDVWRKAEPLYSVQYYLHDATYPPLFPLEDNPEWFEHTTEHDGLQVYRNLRALPRARLVGSIKTFENEDELIAGMAKDEFDPATEAYVLRDDLPAQYTVAAVADNQGSAEFTTYSSVRAGIKVTANEDSLLVLSDAYYPGWTATLNGASIPIYPVYHAFRGVFVPKGEHVVEFTYFPASFRIGLAASSVTLVALLVWALVSLRRRAEVKN